MGIPATKPLEKKLTEQIQTSLEDLYDLGRFTGADIIHGGTVNTSFRVRMSASGKARHYFLREYNPAILEPEIRFEHALLNHLRNSGFELASVPVLCRNGATYFRAPASSPGGRGDAFWALFNFLKGQDKYTWTETDLTDREFVSSAAILALLHHHGSGFVKPDDGDRAQPSIMNLLPILKQKFDTFAASAGDRRCDRLFKAHLHRIQSVIATGLSNRKNYRGMLKIPIHCDYHPGNLKFENEKGVGLFDFDWSKIDYRLFDLALALVYFTVRWRGADAGSIRLKPFKLFIKVYQDACTRLACVAPLSPREQQALVSMLACANIYVLNWSLSDFYGKTDADDQKYYPFIHHGVRLMEWIEDHEPTLTDAVLDSAGETRSRHST